MDASATIASTVKYCFLNGDIMPVDKAFVRIDDIGILRGYGVFDFLRTYNGKPFLLKEHLLRLKNSAKALALVPPLSDKKIAALIDELLKKNKVQEAQVRILLTGGRTVNGMGYDSKNPTFAILIEPLAVPSAELYKKGGTLITNTHMRHVHTAKTTNYINAIVLARERIKKDAIEILYLFHDYVLECSTSNFFIFKGDTLITAKDNILLGTTRNFILKFVAKGFNVEERDIKVSELKEANEAFLTATNKEILPITKIDDVSIGNGKIGKNTKKLMKKFASLTSSF